MNVHESMGGQRAIVIVVADNFATAIDPKNSRIDGTGKGDINRREDATILHIAASPPGNGKRICVEPYDLPRVVDSERSCGDSTGKGHINGSEFATVIEEPVVTGIRILVNADNFSCVIYSISKT